uniref:DnaJ homolog subfamily C member 7 n=1 Tax=Xenopsylla cheopis TaxID=163159 RepID=A0A6M2DFZ9_XENCH
MADVLSSGSNEQIDMDIEEIIPKNPETLAEAKKETGNELYKVKNYRGALPLYTEAIALCPDVPSYYGNRAACYMMLSQFKNALEDARKAVLLDSNFVKGYVRIAKCCVSLGDLAGLDQAITKVKELEPNSTAILQEEKTLFALRQHEEDYEKTFLKGDFRSSLYYMDRALDYTPTCHRYKIRRAECLALLGRYQESQEIVNDILMFDKSNADAIYVRGMCLYYQDNIEQAFKHFQHVLKLAPDHVRAMDVYKKARLLKQKKQDGNDAFKAGKFQDAYTLYTEALQIDPQNVALNSKLFFNRATVLSRQKKQAEAIVDCTSALKLDENYLKALLRRAKCYGELGDWEEAVKDYEKAHKMDKSRENRRLLQDAKVALKRSKRKDYYKILGIEKNASDDEIKKAYRKRALVHHPDRHASASEAERKEQEKKFKEVGEAYSVLADPKKRVRYDNGQDLEDMDGHGMHADIDPTQVFTSFFDNAGGYSGSSFFQTGFPGGNFSFQFG